MPKPPKPPDENDKKCAQKDQYDPGNGLVPYELASAVQHRATAHPAAKLPTVPTASRALIEPLADELAPSVVFPYNGWRKAHSVMPPCLRGSWLLLPWKARLLYRELSLLCDDDGVLALGNPGLRAVCGLIHAPLPDDWKQIEPLLQELIEPGWIVWFEDEPHRLTVAWFRESQNTARSDEAARKARYRYEGRDKTGTVPGQDPRESRDKTGTVPGQSHRPARARQGFPRGTALRPDAPAVAPRAIDHSPLVGGRATKAHRAPDLNSSAPPAVGERTETRNRSKRP